MPSKYEMLKALVPEAYINPRHEGHFTHPDYGLEGWSRDETRTASVEQEERPFNQAMLKLESLAKKDPKYLEEIITKATGTNFDIGKTYQVLSKENPSRDEMVSAVKEAWQRGDEDRQPWWWDSDMYEEYGEFPAGLAKMSDEDLIYKIRNYAPNSIMRAAEIYDLELDRKDIEDLMQGRRKPRNLDELRKLARGATGNSWDPGNYGVSTPKGAADKELWDFKK